MSANPKETILSTVKSDGTLITIPVEVFTSEIYDRDFYLPLEDIQTVLAMLINKQDPTRAPNSKGERFTFGSVESAQAHLQAIVRNYMHFYGEMFRAPQPTWFDRKRLKLCRLEPDSAFSILYHLGFSAGLPNFVILSKNLYQLAISGSADWPVRTVYPLAYMPDDYSAIYIRSSETRLVKVTSDDITEVDLGTDNVIISGEKLGDLPPFDELLSHVEILRPLIGNSITRIVPNSPLTTHYKTRFSQEDLLSYDQAHTMALARLMFMFCAAQHPYLWPIELFTGEGSSGKSTLPEKKNVIFRGDARKIELDSMPIKMRDLIGLITNADYISFDNVDHAFDEAQPELINMMCRLATGAAINLNVLYQTNTAATYSLLKHTSLTARANPFERDDILRRVLHFKMASGEGKEDKTLLMKAVLDDRPAIWGEILIRCQNMIQAHQLNGRKKYSLITKMNEYEAYTRLCADFEGTLPETHALWLAYNGTYKDAITMDNSLVTSVLIWLGQDLDRAKRVYSATGLHAGLLAIHKEIGIEFPWKFANSFGKALTNNAVSLSAGACLHLKTNNSKGTRDIFFRLTPEISAIATGMYQDGHQNSSRSANSLVVKRGPSLESLKISVP